MKKSLMFVSFFVLVLVGTGCGGGANSGSGGGSGVGTGSGVGNGAGGATGASTGAGSAGDVATDLPIAQQIDALIDMDLYEDALARLEGQDTQDPQIRMLREKTHLNYGLHSMMTFDQTEMRTRMNRALRQFTIVLEINPQNRVAREQIDQILMIYGTMPDRSPDPDVLEGLRKVGYEI